jgi:hypothetical protein
MEAVNGADLQNTNTAIFMDFMTSPNFLGVNALKKTNLFWDFEKLASKVMDMVYKG